MQMVTPEPRAPLAMRAAKECVDRGLDVDLNTALAIESQQFAACFATKDREVGMQTSSSRAPARPSSRVADRRATGRPLSRQGPSGPWREKLLSGNIGRKVTRRAGRIAPA